MPPLLLNIYLVLSYFFVALQILKLREEKSAFRVKDLIVLIMAPFNFATILTFWVTSRFVDPEKILIE